MRHTIFDVAKAAIVSSAFVFGLSANVSTDAVQTGLHLGAPVQAQEKDRGGSGTGGPGDGSGMGYGQSSSGGAGKNRGPGGGSGSFNPAHHLHFGDVPAGVGSGDESGHVVGEGGSGEVPHSDHGPEGSETDTEHEHGSGGSGSSGSGGHDSGSSSGSGA